MFPPPGVPTLTCSGAKGGRRVHACVFCFFLISHFILNQFVRLEKQPVCAFLETCRFLNGVITGFTVTRVCPANTEGLVEHS